MCTRGKELSQCHCLPTQQTHSSVLNPSILWSQGFPPEIPLPDKPSAAHKGLNYSSSLQYISSGPPNAQFLLNIRGNTVTKSKTARALAHKLARIWEMGSWSCHSCISLIQADLLCSALLSFSLCLSSVSRTPMLCWQGANLPPPLVVSFSRVQRKAPVEWLLCLLLAASPHWEAVLIVWASVFSPTR